MACVLGISAHYHDAAAALVVDNLKQWRAGGSLRNVVDPDRGY